LVSQLAITAVQIFDQLLPWDKWHPDKVDRDKVDQVKVDWDTMVKA
jgi:hypothetical protein